MNNRGFTLIELIIYIAVVSVVLLAFVTFTLRFANSRAKARVIGEVQYNGRLIQERLSDAFRHAEAVNTGASTFTTDPGVLSLDIVDVAEDPTIFSLSADDGNFQVNLAGSGNTLITSDAVSVSNLVFTNLTSSEDVGVVRVEFTVAAINNSNDPHFDYDQTYQTTLRIPLDNE